MGDYNLHGLNPRDFQHLVQAIAKKKIAAGVTPYGEGKDGARDLSFLGRMDYPSLSAPWDGYLVGGCKFRQVPQGTKRDLQWAIKQLEEDLKKFADKKRRLEKPKYYLFATNVALTPVPKVGGRARVEDVLRDYSAKLGLQDFAIWDYNDLRGFLDGDADIRKAYGTLITAGDVLAIVAESAKISGPQFVEVMHTYLQKELLGDTAAKLQFGGEDEDVRIPLASVFVDLPIADSVEAANAPSDEENPAMAVKLLLVAGTQVLRGTPDDNEGQALVQAKRQRVSRFVIVGGPGQGKSTLGQYLCQIYRAAILQDRPKNRLDDRVLRIIRDLRDSATETGGLPLARRFPLRVELRVFSHALAANPRLSLREYLRTEIANLGGYKLSEDDFRTWLAMYPWALLLDGLDEVPPSSNRGDVVRCIEHFRVDAASANSDMFIVVTTRPQSYSDEFPRNEFAHLYLRPLSRGQALSYGKKLAIARCGPEEKRRDELINSLAKACKNEATVKLMQSPLQVTIMATLLEETGEPPQQRYRLFAEYYRTIYRRETRRKLLGGVLSERQTDIDTIHATAGLLLHAAGERISASDKRSEDSALSDNQFREIVRRRLVQLKVPEAKASELLARITDGSLQRLVFLVRPTEGWVRFDITSFKEFMAAEALMIGPEDDIRERLTAIGPASYWRNVLLFAIGRCFVEREHMLGNVVSLCALLNQERSATTMLNSPTAGQSSQAVLWGSRLALDILLDGTAAQYPGYEVQFATIALELAKVGDTSSCAMLASVCHDDLNDLFRQFISDRLGQANFWLQLGAWYLLMSLAERGIEWASELLQKSWPTDVEHARVLLCSRGYSGSRRFWLRRVTELAPNISPEFLQQTVTRSYRLSEKGHWPGHWEHIAELVGRGTPLQITNHSRWKDMFTACRIGRIRFPKEVVAALSKQRFVHPVWDIYLSAVKFATNPSACELGSALTVIADRWNDGRRILRNYLPWPIVACLNVASSKEELLDLASRASKGEMGDQAEWNAAETRWQHRGIQDADLEVSEEDWPYSKNINQCGFPFAACTMVAVDDVDTSKISSWVERLPAENSTRLRAWLAERILSSWIDVRWNRNCPLTPNMLKDLMNASSGRRHRRVVILDCVFDLRAALPLSTEWLEILDRVGKENRWVSTGNVRPECAQDIATRFCAEPDRWRGLLSLLVEFAMEGSVSNIPRPVLEKIKTWEGSGRESATVLSLTRNDLSDDEVRNLAESAAEHDVVWQACRVAARTSSDLLAKFALAVLKVLTPHSEEEWDGMEYAKSQLVNFLTKRASNLDQPGVWERLHLPNRV